MSHSSVDKPLVEMIGNWLRNHDPKLQVWIDKWSLVPGDSLVDKLNDAISDSDRLVVFLSPDSLNSTWVQKEVAAGVVLEAAKKKGFGGSGFVVPVLLKKLPTGTSIPPLLMSKIYADFPSSGSVDEACAALYRGLKQTPQGPQPTAFSNLNIRYETKSLPSGKYQLLVIFEALLTKERVGFKIDAGQNFDDVKQYFTSSRHAQAMMSIHTNRIGTSYCVSIRDPQIEQGQPFFVEFTGPTPFLVKPVVSPWTP